MVLSENVAVISNATSSPDANVPPSTYFPSVIIIFLLSVVYVAGIPVIVWVAGSGEIDLTVKTILFV